MTSKGIFPENLLASKEDNLILCSYLNITPQIQILKLNNPDDSSWERVVFPGERILFLARAEVKLEIQTHDLSNFSIPCLQLRVI